jgi:hypothetical protein
VRVQVAKGKTKLAVGMARSAVKKGICSTRDRMTSTAIDTAADRIACHCPSQERVSSK